MAYTLATVSPVDTSTDMSMLYLRQSMLEVINNAFTRDGHSVESLAAAIAVAASWEAKFGDLETQMMHIQAFQDVVNNHYASAMALEPGLMSGQSTPSSFVSPVPATSPPSLSRSAESSPGLPPIGFTEALPPASATTFAFADNLSFSYGLPPKPFCAMPYEQTEESWPGS